MTISQLLCIHHTLYRYQSMLEIWEDNTFIERETLDLHREVTMNFMEITDFIDIELPGLFDLTLNP